MKSFRLDRDSIPSPKGWGALAAAGLLTVLLFRYGAFDGGWSRAWLAAFGVVMTAGIARDLVTGRLARRFPRARSRWLLGTAMLVTACGLTFFFASPPAMRGRADLLWLGPSFVLILAFVLLNRRTPNVID